MKCVVGEQYRTANPQTRACSRSLQRGEATVRVERLEVEVDRYGRIVPTSRGSYHILDAPTPRSLAEGSVHSLSENSKVVHAYCSVDEVNVAVTRVGRETRNVTGATDRASGVYDANSDSNADENCARASDLGGADVSSQINKTISGSCSSDNHVKKSTHECGGWEIDLTVYAASSSSSSGNVESLKRVSRDCQYWKPIYEPISDPDSESDCTNDTVTTKKPRDDLVCAAHVNLHCDRSRNVAGQSTSCSLRDVRKHKAQGINKRRHSAPGDAVRNCKKVEREKKRHRRRSFSPSVLQIDHRDNVNKHYLNRLLFSKDAKMHAGSIFIDIAHDEHTLEEFQFPEPHVVKEEKEAITAAPEQHSSRIEHSARASSSRYKETMSEDYPSFEFKREWNINGEGTIEASRGFIIVPINQACISRNVLEESLVSGRVDRAQISRSARNNSVISSTSGILNEAEVNCELPSEIPETQTTEAGVITRLLIGKLKAEGSVPAEVILRDNKSNLFAINECCPCGSAVCATCEKEKFVQSTSYNSAESMKTHDCYNREAHFQNTENTKHSVEASANVKRYVCSNNGPGLKLRISSEECFSVATTNDLLKNMKYANQSVDALPAKTIEVSGACSTCASTEKCVPVNNSDSNGNPEEWSHLAPKASCSSTETDKQKLSRNVESHSLIVLPRICSQQHVSGEENIKRKSANTCASTEKSVPVNTDCNGSPEEWSHLAPKASCSSTETDKQKLSINVESHSLIVSPRMCSQQHVSGEENIKRMSANTNSLRSYGQPLNGREEKENENDSDQEGVIRENIVSGSTVQTDLEPDVDTQIESKNTGDVSKLVREYRELTNGDRGFSVPKRTKRRSAKKRPEHDSNKEASGDDSKIRRKKHGPRQPRYSRRSFRHDSIQMFKVSSAFPPQNTRVMWPYKRKKPEFRDSVDPKVISPPSPVMNPCHTQSRCDDGVTNIEIDDDIPSPASLTIDLGEQNANALGLSSFEEDARSQGESNTDGSNGEEDVVSPVRATSSEADSSGTKEETHSGTSPNIARDENQVGDMGSESNDEGQKKKKRKKAKRSKTGDESVSMNVTQSKLTAQMEEKGRRLAQELPGFNWLEEKIRNGGVTTVQPPKRLGGGLVVDPPKSIPTSSTVPDATTSSVLPTSSCPPKQRNGKRQQEYLLRSPKRTRSSPTGVPENGSERQELEPSLQERRQHADAPSAPLAVAPVSPLQPLHNSQQSSPRTVSEREESPHQQSPRRPVIVCGADLAKSSDVRPLLKQLTSGGELEVTLSTPSASSASSDSGIVSLSSHRTSSDAGQPDVTHISVKPVNTGNRQQYAEGSPHDAPQHHFASSKRISYTVEQLSQPHQSAQSIFPPREHVPVSLWNGEPPWWQHDVRAREDQESSSANAVVAYSERISTMARHAATSFDTGFGMGLTLSREVYQRIARYHHNRLSVLAHQPSIYHRERMLAPHVQQPGACDFGSSQYRLCQPWYMDPQQSVHPHIVRPSAQYPAGVRLCVPSNACSQSFRETSNGQGFFPGIPQHSCNLTESHPSMFSPRASRRKTDSSMSSTRSAVPSAHSSSVQETASEAPSSTQTETQIPGPQFEAHASSPEDQGVISDSVAEENNPPKNIEEIRKAREAAVEELEMLEQLKESTRNELERLKLAKERAVKELARTQQLEEAGVYEAGKAVEPRTAVPPVAEERRQPLVQDNQKSAQRPDNTADASGSSITLTSSYTQEINWSAPERENNKLGGVCKNDQSDISQKNLQSGSAHWNKQLAFTSENHHLGAACSSQQSSDECDNEQSKAAHEKHTSEAVCKNQQSTVAPENCQSGAVCKNQQLTGACGNNQTENEGENNSPVSRGDRHTEFTCRNLPTQQNCSVTLDSTVIPIWGLNATFPAVMQANQRLESTHENCKTQKKQHVSADSIGNSVPVQNTALKEVMWEKQSSRVASDSSEKQQVASGSSDSADSSIPKLHTKMHTEKSENNLTQKKLTVSSNSTGNSVTQLNLTFPAATHENHQSDIVCINHEMQQKLNVTSDNTKSSVSALNVTPQAAVPVNKQSGVMCDSQQSESACRNHTRLELSTTSGNRLSGSSVRGLNATSSALSQENQQQGDACGQCQSAVPCESRSVQRTSGSSIPGLQVAYPAVTGEKYQSRRNCNVSANGTMRNSTPALVTTCPTTRCVNKEAVPRPFPPSPLLVRPALPVPETLPQQWPVHTLPVSRQVTHSRLQPASHSHPVKGAYPPLPHMPQPSLYPQMSQAYQTALKSESSVSETSSHFQASPHFHSFSESQTAPHYKPSLSLLSPHSHSSIINQKFPHSQALSVSDTAQNSHSLPVSQIPVPSQSFPVPRTSSHAHLPQVSQVSVQSQSLPLFQTPPYSQPGLASQPSMHRQTLEALRHSVSKTQLLQVPRDQFKSPADLPRSSVEILAAQGKMMPPPLPCRRKKVLPKPPESLVSQIPPTVLSRRVSHPAAPDPITVHSLESPSGGSVITQVKSVQQSSVITQEPHVIITDTSNRGHSSTAEEYPIDLSIGKQKSATEDKNKPPVSATSVVQPLRQHNEQSNPGRCSTYPSHHQDRSQIQPSVVHNLRPEEHNVTDYPGILCHNQRMAHAHTSQIQSAQNSGRQQQQFQTFTQTGSKGRHLLLLPASVSTAGNPTGKGGIARRADGHQMSVPECSSRQKQFETPRDQNVDGGSVLHGQNVHIPVHSEVAHYSQHNVHQDYSNTLVPSSFCIPANQTVVVHGLRSGQQQRNHTSEIHTASAVLSRKERCLLDEMQASTTTVAPHQPSQDADSQLLLCGHCRQIARFTCAACHNEWYCSGECQATDWRRHSVRCSLQYWNEGK